MEGQLERQIERHEIGDYLVADPEICHGRLTFKGTRIPVSTVLTFLGMGDSIDDILEDWPQLSREAVLEALRLAADIIADRYPGLRLVEGPDGYEVLPDMEHPVEHQEIGEYLVVDPEIVHGRLTFNGTRIPVSTVLTFLGMGYSIDDILRNWSRLSREGVLEALRLAADVVADHYSGQ